MKTLPCISARAAVLALCLAPGLFDAPPARAETLVAPAGPWRFFRGAEAPPAGWATPDFDDARWEGPAPGGFGFGDRDDATVLTNMTGKFVTVYIRATFEVAEPAAVPALTLAADYDDGFVAYLNGVEVARRNLPGGEVGHTTTALRAHAASRTKDDRDCNDVEYIAVDPARLAKGRNVLAVSGHNVKLGSSDFSLAVGLSAGVNLIRGPFLQMPEPGRLAVCWRTDAESEGVVAVGADEARPEATARHEGRARDHVVPLPPLAPGPDRPYRVLDGTRTLARGTLRPPKAPGASIRFAIIGDFGTGSPACTQVAWRVTQADPDFVVTTGDNVYDYGAPGDYDREWFRPYADAMRRVPMFPSLGNHDANLGNSRWMATNFCLPRNGPAAMKELVYSFDYGPAHFAVIDSNLLAAKGKDRRPDAITAMCAWLDRDLGATTQSWRFVVLHHPPYTSRSNHGDNEEVQKSVLPVAEKHRVHVLWSGHNHFYERLGPINGVWHVIAGGSGNALYGRVLTHARSAVFFNERNSYVTAEIAGARMDVRAYDLNGKEVDAFGVDAGGGVK